MTTAAVVSLWDVNLGYPAARAASPGSPCIPFVMSMPSPCFSLASLVVLSSPSPSVLRDVYSSEMEMALEVVLVARSCDRDVFPCSKKDEKTTREGKPQDEDDAEDDGQGGGPRNETSLFLRRR